MAMPCNASAKQARDSKLKQINKLRRSVPYVSAAALEAIVKEIAKEGIPQLSGRKHMREGASNQLAEINGFGPLLQQFDAVTLQQSVVKLTMVNFLSLLSGAFGQGGSYHDLIMKTHLAKPSTFTDPWGVCIYADELHPGNQLSLKGARKLWAVYATLTSFGQAVMSNSAAWMVLFVCRSEIVNQLDGNIGQCIKLLLHSMFNNPYGNPAYGVPLQCGGTRIRLFLQLQMFLQDGGAMKYTFSVRGDGASRFCPMCKNLFVLKAAVCSEEDDEDCSMMCKTIKHSELDLCYAQTVSSSKLGTGLQTVVAM